MLISAGSRVPYYKKLFKRINFDPHTAVLPDDLERIPILTKAVIQDNIHELLAEDVHESDLCENATGGSTGVPLKFYQDKKYLTVACALDSFVREWWGVKPYDRTALIWGADRDFSELSLKEKIYELRSRTKSLNAFRMTDENLVEFCRAMERWKPPYLMGYATALETMAKCARENGVDNLKFRAVRSTAETLRESQRTVIEEFLNGPVYNFYGSREVNNLTAECREERSMHMISTWRDRKSVV